MKCSQFGWALACLFQLVSAAPSASMPSALAQEKAKIGFATLEGGTTGGIGGPTTTVTTLEELQAAVAGDSPAIVIISGTIQGNTVVEIGSNKSVLGKDSDAYLEGVGLTIAGKSNVIIRNLRISKVLASTGGDAIGLRYADNVWIDHVDLSSDLDHGKDYYDGLLDITHKCNWITVSYSYLHDHYKASLVGHADTNGAEDKGHLTVTFVGNHFKNIKWRTPSLRFGHAHIYNNMFENLDEAVHTRDGAEMLLERNVFRNVTLALFSSDGCANYESGKNDFGGAKIGPVPTGHMETMPYNYSLIDTSLVGPKVVAIVGNILTI